MNASTHLPGFRKSSYCSQDACVEVAFIGDETLIRDGKARQAPLLRFTASAWTAFVEGVVTGKFDRISTGA